MLALLVTCLSASPEDAADAGETDAQNSESYVYDTISDPPAGLVPEKREGPARWIPVQGNATGTGSISPSGASSLGVSFYVGYAHGSAHIKEPWLTNREGLFWGVGAIGFFGTIDIPDCFGALRCAARRWGGAAARVGYAFFRHTEALDDTARFYWPHAYVYAQVGGFLGAEAVPSAPLAPGVNAGLRGLRFELGITSVAFSKLLGEIWGDMMTKSNDPRTVLFGVLLLPIILLNHLELQVEVSNTALSAGGVRFGLAFGSGF